MHTATTDILPVRVCSDLEQPQMNVAVQSRNTMVTPYEGMRLRKEFTAGNSWEIVNPAGVPRLLAGTN